MQIAAVKSALESRVLKKICSLESILQPINRLPKDIFIRIPRFFVNEKGDYHYNAFPMNKPLITMTHVCRSWRNVLLSTPTLWTQIDFSKSAYSQQAEGFLRRSGNQLLDVHQFLESEDHVEPFLSTTLHNIHRLRSLEIVSFLWHLERVLTRFTRSAPELKHLTISNDPNITDRDMRLHKTIFEDRLPKLTTLTLHRICTNLRDFNFPSLTRFTFVTGTEVSVRNLTSFFERCPLLEFIRISLRYMPQPPTAPPRRRVLLATLQELRLDQTACTTGLLDHLVLPKCTEMMLEGQFTDEAFDQYGSPAAQLHPSSINHLPVTRGITKAVAMPKSCVLSGPNGTLRFWCFDGARENFDADFFTLFSPISALQITELWVGRRAESHFGGKSEPWKQTVAGVHSAFEVLTKVEDLIIVSCETEPFFTTLGTTVNGGVLLPGLQRLTIYVGCGDLDVPALIQSAKSRKEHFRPLGEVTVVLEEDPGANVMQEVELLREFVGGLIYRVGKAPKLSWEGDNDDVW